ncbi:putative quinol monooxygenase [Pseudomonas putida]|uniref:putative quinol monooxygenase n=1 Tax=Pseudomonas putida TaxID=303 RepID=UPI003839CFE6
MSITKTLSPALLAMSLVTAKPASANDTATQPVTSSTPLQLFVTLPVKPDHLDRFLATMHKEVAGARSEAGNVAFDVYEDAQHPSRLYLFEHWRNAESLASHTTQPYYKAIRAQEADDLDGTVEERKLLEIAPAAPVRSAAPAQYSVLSTLHLAPGKAEQLATQFAAQAGAIRSAQGNLGLAMYQDEEKPDELLLIERWSDRAAHDASASSPAARQFLASLNEVVDAQVLQLRLIDRSTADH